VLPVFENDPRWWQPVNHQWLRADDENGPTAKELRPDAHGCIMVSIQIGSTEYKVAARSLDLRAFASSPQVVAREEKERTREK
jgi:hypothetical protein